MYRKNVVNRSYLKQTKNPVCSAVSATVRRYLSNLIDLKIKCVDLIVVQISSTS